MKIIILLLIIIWFITLAFNFLKFNLILFLFVFSSALERFWETFIASRQYILDKKTGFDWLFDVIALCYIAMMFGAIFEYLFISKKLIIWLIFFGLIVFSFALILRLWAIKTLGHGWNTFVLGESKREASDATLLMKSGPYKFIRHPIYLGAIFESISIPLVLNSYYTLGFVILICVPLFILRAYLEEKESIKKFGSDYMKYRSEVPAFLPLM